MCMTISLAVDNLDSVWTDPLLQKKNFSVSSASMEKEIGDMVANNGALTPEIIYEDDEVLVINKPYGLLVHEDWTAGDSQTVVEWFLDRVPSAHGVGEVTTKPDGTPLERSGVVHRLDRETSGVMILAKTAEAHALLKTQFHDRMVKERVPSFCLWSTSRPVGNYQSSDWTQSKRLQEAFGRKRGQRNPA